MTSPWQKPFRGMQINKAHPLARGLLGSWVMNEATGDKVFDLSGNGNHGTLTNSPTWNAEGLYFNGTADRYVDLGKPVIPTGDFTIVSYVNVTNYAQYRGIVSQYGSGQAGRLQYTTKVTSGNIWSQITGIMESNTPIGTGSLHQCIMTRNGSTVSFYLDGVYDGGATNSTSVYQGANTLIGHSGTNRWLGTIAHTMIYGRGISAEEAAYLHREPYAMFEQPISPAQLYYELVGDVSTDLLHGKIIIKDSSIVLVDGLVKVQDISTDLFDGKLQVQDTDTDLADGLISVKDSSTDLADGKVQIQDSVTDLADGKVIVTTAGLDTGYADGKIQIKDVTTGIVDGIIKVKDSVTGLADGKVKIGNIGSNLADGLIRIKDTATGIADGKVQIKDVATGTADGLLKVIKRATSNIDGKLKIKDSIKDLADGKISITGVATAIIRRITIANKKPSYRLVAEQPKPTYRLKTENK